jgi:hypothetical protein
LEWLTAEAGGDNLEWERLGRLCEHPEAHREQVRSAKKRRSDAVAVAKNYDIHRTPQ